MPETVEELQEKVRQLESDRRMKVALHAVKDGPKYTHCPSNRQTWQGFITRRKRWGKLYAFDETSDARVLKESLMLSLEGVAGEMATSMATDEEIDAMTYDQLIKNLTDLFQPPAESELAKSEFRGRKQGNREDIMSYLSQKEALFKRAYPTKEVQSLNTLVEEAIKGLVNRTIRKQLTVERYRTTFTNFQQLRERAASCVAAEHALLDAGIADSTSYDGLSATSVISKGGWTKWDADDDSMDISTVSRMNERSCYNCGKTGHVRANCPAPKKKSQVGTKGSTGAKKPFKGTCNRCGRTGHVAKKCFAKKTKGGQVITEPKVVAVGGVGDDDDIEDGDGGTVVDSSESEDE